NGSFTLPDQNRVLQPDPRFRLFATSNTIGLGNTYGIYHGVQRLNQAQLDRWNIVAVLDYLAPAEEASIVRSRAPGLAGPDDPIDAMVALANLTRWGFRAGDLSTLMSPRTLITWAENLAVFHDLDLAFRLTFLNRCD